MGGGSASWGVWGSAPPYVVQFCGFSPCNGLPPPPPPPATGLPSLYIRVCSPHHLSESPHQWISRSCPIICRGVSYVKSLPCPLPNKLFVVLYKIIGKLLLSTCLTNLKVSTLCFTR